MSGEETVLLLVHGLAGNGRLWDGVASRWDRGPVIAPDLAGHGAAPRLDRYDIGDLAGDLARRIGPELAGRAVVAAGHSLGAIVLLELIRALPDARFQRVVALSTKTIWSDEELAGLHRTVHRAPLWFDDERAARARFLLVAGLADDLPVEHPAAGHGVERHERRWRLVADPATYLVEVPDLRPKFFGLPCPLVLARGELDPLATVADMEGLGAPVSVLPGCRHNPHVEAPDLVLPLLS